jgi:hypothetical protein
MVRKSDGSEKQNSIELAPCSRERILDFVKAGYDSPIPKQFIKTEHNVAFIISTNSFIMDNVSNKMNNTFSCPSIW